jgi:Asp-tRNA(Asn)/Glu-tRNA(Gln) amidotransferase A subunit family amidase
VQVDCPSFEYALAAYYLIAPSECSSNLARFDAMRYGLRSGDSDGASAETIAQLQATQIRLATEQARYEITFRQDLAEIADQLRRPR